MRDKKEDHNSVVLFKDAGFYHVVVLVVSQQTFDRKIFLFGKINKGISAFDHRA